MGESLCQGSIDQNFGEFISAHPELDELQAQGDLANPDLVTPFGAEAAVTEPIVPENMGVKLTGTKPFKTSPPENGKSADQDYGDLDDDS